MRPTHLPKVRDQVLRHFDDPTSALRTQTGEYNRIGLDATASHLRVAGLYWVAPDMAALAVSAGGQLAAARWATADRPSACGLVVFDGGVGHVDAMGVQIPVEACTWGPAGGGCAVGLWISRQRAAEGAAERGAELVVGEVPPLLPIRSWVLPVAAEPMPFAELPADAPTAVLAALAATWLLMQQPVLVDRTLERPDKSVRRVYARQGRPDPEVTIVDLRRQYVPQDRDPDAGTDGRRYRHRWVVSGHWKNVAHGRDRALRRQQWIPAHLKGPDGAQLLVTEKVNVWRR